GMYCLLKSLNMGEKTGPCPELIYCYIFGGTVWSLLSWESRALRDSTIGLNSTKMAGDKMLEGSAYISLSIVLFMFNRTLEGLENAKKGISLLKGLGEYWDLGIGYVFRIQHSLIAGRLHEAFAASEEFLALAKETQALQNLGWAYVLRGKTLALLGDVTDQTIEEIKRGLALLEKTNDKANFLFGVSILSLAYLRKRRHHESIQTVERVLNLLPTHYSYGSWTLELFPLCAQSYLDSMRDLSELSKEKKKIYLKKAHWFCKKSFKWSKNFNFITGWTCQVNGTYHWVTNRKQDAVRNWESGITYLRDQTEDRYRLGYILMEAGSYLIHEHNNSD
ncbi:MAG: hypothetical protein D3910_29305, partial [Candidatus Electrothrix sp. ATG2]|nr:hypothetical protein [Candidatus Electrothrix sp. ATG2]